MKASEMIEVIQAYEDGKTIEYATKNMPQYWNTCMTRPVWDFNHCDYRVKAEPIELWCVMNKENKRLYTTDTKAEAEQMFSTISNENKKRYRIIHLVEAKTSE